MTLIEADALTSPIWELGTAPRRIIANLPYNIATTLLIRWLTHANCFDSMTLMFQREVAERITARPGEATYGRLSVLTGWLADAEILFDVPASAFVPPPKITSTLIRVIPRPAPLFDCEMHHLEAVTQIAFGQRRKMLRASFKQYGGADMLSALDIDPSIRPQELSVEGFCRLASSLSGQLGQPAK